jgi:signal transduction histidine kinase
MTITDSLDISLESRVRWRSLIAPAVAGFWFGYLVLHPLSMVIFQCLDPRIAHAGHHGTDQILAPIAHSFHADMLMMGLVFGMVGASITTFYGYHRLALTLQKERLAEQLAHNERLRAELAEQAEQLRENNEELARLELANRRTSQFMAHDFKTALACVGGFAGTLLKRPELHENKEVADALACIRRQAHRMMGSVTDLLEFARAREGLAPRVEPVSPAQLLREAVGDFSLPAQATHVALGDRNACCPAVSGDPRLLRRVLCNLIANAFAHNSRETHVWVDAEIDESGAGVLFSCGDDGAGIPPKVLPSIFKEFTTAGDPAGGSTGLGLAFCRTVVEAHGGRIWCENLDRGARFLFTIPLHKEHDNDK